MKQAIKEVETFITLNCSYRIVTKQKYYESDRTLKKFNRDQ